MLGKYINKNNGVVIPRTMMTSLISMKSICFGSRKLESIDFDKNWYPPYNYRIIEKTLYGKIGNMHRLQISFRQPKHSTPQCNVKTT